MSDRADHRALLRSHRPAETLVAQRCPLGRAGCDCLGARAALAAVDVRNQSRGVLQA